MIAPTMSPMSPSCLTNARLNACSVCVFVSWSEFALIASIAAAILSDSFGSLTRAMYQPIVPLPNVRPSSK
jgi:hypothetical protein